MLLDKDVKSIILRQAYRFLEKKYIDVCPVCNENISVRVFQDLDKLQNNICCHNCMEPLLLFEIRNTHRNTIDSTFSLLVDIEEPKDFYYICKNHPNTRVDAPKNATFFEKKTYICRYCGLPLELKQE